jgi:drug/metabolite transporter (DMT)-like permease
MSIFGLLTIEGSLFSGVGLKTLGLMSFMGVALVYFNKLTLVAQKHIDTAPYMVLRQVAVPTSVILSTVFLGESLTLAQAVGMMIILFGSYLIASNGGKIKLKHIGKYELMAIVYGVFLAFYSIASRYLQLETSLSTILVIGGLLEIIPNILVASGVKSKSHESKINKNDIFLACLIGLFSAMHIVAFWLAVYYAGNIALISSLGSFRIVTIFVASYIFLKEKDDLKMKIVGTLLALLGLLLV